MSIPFPWISRGVVLVLGAFLAAGCGGSGPEPDPDPVDTEPVVLDDPGDEVEPEVRDETKTYIDPNVEFADVFRSIHFEFNKYRITPEAKPILEGISVAMKDHPDWKILIEGHCDERGTHEYNLALGENRAQSTKRYLVSLGLSESRFQTISYGEERPVDSRSTEDAWTKNRRSEFRVQAPGS